MQLLFLLLTSLVALVSARTLSATLHFRSIGPDSKPKAFANVYYGVGAASFNVEYEPLAGAPSIPAGLVQIGILDEKTNELRGGVVQSDIFASTSEYKPLIRLHVDDTGSLYHVDVAAERATAAKAIVVADQPGPSPVLRKPIPLDKDGKIPVPTQEKTLLQKYWWVLLGVAVLAIGGGGAAEE